MSTRCSGDWRDLPFAEIWVVDTEYYPGHGLAHGSVKGDPITPLCLAAIELRSGRVVQQWQGEFGPFPPYRLDPQVLFVSYLLTAEFGFHQALGWGQPAAALDPYVEFRRITNDARIKSGDREKGFYALPGALRWFEEDTLDLAHKKETRDRILQGPPFTNDDRETIQRYCLDDAEGLARVFKRVVRLVPSLPHAYFRGGQFEWAQACQERRGVPIDLVGYRRIVENSDAIRLDLVTEEDAPYGCYEIVEGVPHWRNERFRDWLQRQGMPWFYLPSGELDLKARTFRDMAQSHPQVARLHELRTTMAQLRSLRLSVGRDGRNRSLLGPCGTKTARNAPSSAEYIFGPTQCMRFLISPAPGNAIIYRDYRQQEVNIAAELSGDPALREACRGDAYLGIAAQLGFDPATYGDGLRPLFKIVMLGMQYGLEEASFAILANIGRYEAREILARLRARFHVFGDYCRRNIDQAGLDLRLENCLGWTVETPPGTSKRTVRNWPIQSTGSAIMQLVSVLAERRGLPIVAPVHDAFMVEGPIADIADMSRELDRIMREASAMVLQGYEIPTDPGKAFLSPEEEPQEGPIRPGERFYASRGARMWLLLNRLIDRQTRKSA
jgi:hypothetical protein